MGVSNFLHGWRACIGEVPRAHGTTTRTTCSSSPNLVETLLAGTLGLQGEISVRELAKSMCIFQYFLDYDAMPFSLKKPV